MAYSADVAAGDQATAAQYNALRDDALIFVELAGGDNHACGASTTWTDWDVSALVPAGAVAVEVTAKHNAVAVVTFGARKNGSALARNGWAMGNSGVAESVSFTTECDANRVIELYSSTDGRVNYNITGYWIGVGI